MAIVTDPDFLQDGVDVIIDTTAKTIQLVSKADNGSSSIDNAGATGGVTLQCLYSWLKEEWKARSELIKFPFAMEAITPEQFEFINGWKPANDSTRKLIRNAGWSEKSAAGAVLRKYAGIISLGSIGESDQPYYRWNTGSKVNFAYQGPVNEAVQIFGDASNGNFDYSDGGDTLTLYVREWGKTYASSNNTQIGASTLMYQAYRFPLSNATDLKISASELSVASSAPYTGITVEFFGTDQNRNIDGTSAPFRVIITDSTGNASTQQIYEKIQYLLRSNSDMDTGAGTVIGATADALVSFVGDTLVGATSVAIDNLNGNYLNSVELYDKNGVKRLYPFVAAGTINFGSNAGSGDFKYWMFFDTGFGSASAIVVNDKDGNPIQGTYTGSPVAFTFAYDTNTQGGRTAATPAAVKVVGIGLTGGQYVSVDATITRTQGQSVLLAPAQERNYSNT
jgi:hypothetical protein